MSRDAENHPDKLAKVMAVLMAMPDSFERLDDVLPVDDDESMTNPDATVQDDEVWTGDGLLERMETLQFEFGKNVFKYIRELHNGLTPKCESPGSDSAERGSESRNNSV